MGKENASAGDGSFMTWTDTLIYLALWIGVCLVLFFGDWVVMCGTILIVSAMNWISIDRVNAARMEGFELGKKTATRLYLSEQAGYGRTALECNGRMFRVGRDC